MDKLTADGPAPLIADANGKYPVPQPGILKDREYAMEPQANPFPLIPVPPAPVEEQLSPPERPKAAAKKKEAKKA